MEGEEQDPRKSWLRATTIYLFNELIKVAQCQNDCWDTLQTKAERTFEHRNREKVSDSSGAVGKLRSITIMSLAVS